MHVRQYKVPTVEWTIGLRVQEQVLNIWDCPILKMYSNMKRF